MQDARAPEELMTSWTPQAAAVPRHSDGSGDAAAAAAHDEAPSAPGGAQQPTKDWEDFRHLLQEEEPIVLQPLRASPHRQTPPASSPHARGMALLAAAAMGAESDAAGGPARPRSSDSGGGGGRTSQRQRRPSAIILGGGGYDERQQQQRESKRRRLPAAAAPKPDLQEPSWRGGAGAPDQGRFDAGIPEDQPAIPAHVKCFTFTSSFLYNPERRERIVDADDGDDTAVPAPPPPPLLGAAAAASGPYVAGMFRGVHFDASTATYEARLMRNKLGTVLRLRGFLDPAAAGRAFDRAAICLSFMRPKAPSLNYGAAYYEGERLPDVAGLPASEVRAIMEASFSGPHVGLCCQRRYDAGGSSAPIYEPPQRQAVAKPPTAKPAPPARPRPPPSRVTKKPADTPAARKSSKRQPAAAQYNKTVLLQQAAALMPAAQRQQLQQQRHVIEQQQEIISQLQQIVRQQQQGGAPPAAAASIPGTPRQLLQAALPVPPAAAGGRGREARQEPDNAAEVASAVADVEAGLNALLQRASAIGACLDEFAVDLVAVGEDSSGEGSACAASRLLARMDPALTAMEACSSHLATFQKLLRGLRDALRAPDPAVQRDPEEDFAQLQAELGSLSTALAQCCSAVVGSGQAAGDDGGGSDAAAVIVSIAELVQRLSRPLSTAVDHAVAARQMLQGSG